MIVFDSYAWLEYFAGSKEGKKVAEIINSKVEVYTPSLCLAEIKNKFIVENKEYKEWIKFILTRSKIIEIDEQISLLCGNKKKDWKLHMTDALIYACAIFNSLTLLTGDPHFKNLEGVEML